MNEKSLERFATKQAQAGAANLYYLARMAQYQDKAQGEKVDSEQDLESLEGGNGHE